MRYDQLIFEGSCVLVILALWVILYIIVEPPAYNTPTDNPIRMEHRP